MGLEEEVLEGALIDAYALLRRSMVARQAIAEAEATLFDVGASTVGATFLVKVLLDFEAHVRSCQWHGAVS